MPCQAPKKQELGNPWKEGRKIHHLLTQATGREEGWLLCHPVGVTALRLPLHPAMRPWVRRLNLDGEGGGCLLALAGRGARTLTREVRKTHLPKGKGLFGERRAEEE